MQLKDFHCQKRRGYFLLEAVLALTLLIVASGMALSMIHSASMALHQALYALYAENALHNQAALVRAAAVSPNGSLLLPMLGHPLTFSSAEQVFPHLSTVPYQRGGFFVDFLTQYRLVAETGTGVEGEILWEYLLSVRYPHRLPDGTSQEARYTTSIWKSYSR